MESCGDIEVKELNKRASGHAFEIILNPSTPEVSCKSPCPLSPLKKKTTSLDEINRKLDAAKERRESYEAEMLKCAMKQQERTKMAIQKAIEIDSNYSKITQEKCDQKFEAVKENRTAIMAARMEKAKDMDKKTEEVRKKREAMKEVEN